MAFQLRRGLDAERTAGGGIVFAEGELVYITDTEEVYVGDGVTPGGIRVTGNAAASPATLTQNLSLGGFDINGTGNININGTISASNITGGGGGGLIEGQEYAIDIVGDVKAADSAIIVDSSAGVVYADFVGDGSLISNITLDQLADVDTTGVTTDSILKYDGANWAIGQLGEAALVGDLTGSVFADDSTLIINGQNGNINTTLVANDSRLVVRGNGLSIINSNEGGVSIGGLDDSNTFINNSLDISRSGTSGVALVINTYHDSDNAADFKSVKTRGTVDAPLAVQTGDRLLEIAPTGHDGTAEAPAGTIAYVADGAPIGGFTPAKFRVRVINNDGTGTQELSFNSQGTLSLPGDVAIANGSIRFTDSRAIADIVSPQEGEMKFEPNEDSLAFYNSAGWQKVVLTDLTLGLTTFNGGLRLGTSTQAELDQFLEDSTATTGALAYNEDVDRFEFFQAGSWVRFPNAGASIGEVLKWDGSEWSAAPDTGGAEVGSNADFLDGFDGTYYLNWNNFTNKPTLFDGTFASLTGTPTTLVGYGITDAFDGTFASLTGTPTTLVGYGITDAFDGAFSSLTGTPTTLVGYGITDAVAATDLGNFTFTNSILDSSDSSGITITPAVTISSDLTVENDLTVTNKITVDTLEVTNLVTAAGAGTPEITSDTDILLTAGTRVEVSSSPFKLASFTTVERDALSAENGDMIYNTTDNKFQGYENGAWANLI